MANRGRLFVISGPAGAGKSEIVKQVLKKHPDVKLSVSCTTRDPRPNEIDGVHYHFVTEEKFKQLVSEDAFYEWAHVHQNHYGTLKSTVREELEAGHDLILEIDVQGCVQAMAQDPLVKGIFICPPSRENLEKRLRGRGTETEESIRVRLGNVAKEVAQAYKYHNIIIHQDWAVEPNALEIAADEVYAVIAASRTELALQKGFLDELAESLEK
ncbi:MAG: guanylate kinase [Clostridiales bacterium]|nr:guanylate kinase [Clostridiales bacterium]